MEGVLSAPLGMEQVHGPIKSEFGWHLIKVHSRTFLGNCHKLPSARMTGLKDPSLGRKVSVLGFWSKNTTTYAGIMPFTTTYAGIMPFHRYFPATTGIWASKLGTWYKFSAWNAYTRRSRPSRDRSTGVVWFLCQGVVRTRFMFSVGNVAQNLSLLPSAQDRFWTRRCLGERRARAIMALGAGSVPT